MKRAKSRICSHRLSHTSLAGHCPTLHHDPTSIVNKTSDFIFALWELACWIMIVFFAVWDPNLQVCAKLELFEAIMFAVELICGAIYFAAFVHLLGESI